MDYKKEIIEMINGIKKNRHIRVPLHIHKAISGEVGQLSPTSFFID